MNHQPRKPRLDEKVQQPELPRPAEASAVSDFLTQHKDTILRAWESRVASEERGVELVGLALRNDIPALLDELAAWLASGAAPETSLVAARALTHVMQRLDAGFSLAQVFREYRLLRETIIEQVLGAETTEQDRAGASGKPDRTARVKQLARLNAGLDVVLSQSIERFVQERDRRASVERASAAQAVLESETRYRSLFQSMDEGFCIIEVLFEGDRPVDYRFLRVNPAFERHTGLQNATGKRFREMVPDHDQHSLETYGRVAQTGVPARFENAVRALGRFYEVYAFRAGELEQHQVAVLFNDITERKRAEHALRINEEENAFLLKLSDAVRSLSDPAEVQAVVTRIAREDLQADRCYYCEIEGDAAVIRRDASRDGLASVVGVYTLRFPIFKAVMDAGRPFVVRDSHATDLMDEDLKQLCIRLEILSFIAVPVIKGGTPFGILCISQCSPRSWTESEIRLAVETAERTWAAVERARAEQTVREANLQLAEADRRKNEFLAVLSHELRNPLAPIANSLYVLDHAPPGGEQGNRAKQVIGRQVAQLSNLVNDLLDITRIARSKILLQKERIELGEAVRRTIEDYRSLFEQAGVRLELREAPPSIPVLADRTRLAQIIGNLLQNSAKFTPKGGHTSISIAIEGHEAVVRVADTGVGMSRETLDRLFEPFSQAAQSLDRSKGGLGLGLALVKGLVELHGGRVSAGSEGLGRGAEMIVRLPIATGASLEVAPTGQRTGRVRRRVLIVEDNADAADSLSEVLSLGENVVEIAYNGPDGLEKAREFKPEVILCDIGLPGLDGYEVARAVRAEEALKGTFLVALSGYALPEDLQRAADAGFDRHIPKPPTIEKLEELLAEVPCIATAGPAEVDARPPA